MSLPFTLVDVRIAGECNTVAEELSCFIRWDSTRDPRPTRRLREKSREVVIAKCGQMFMPPSNGTFFGTLSPVKLWRFSRTELVNLVIDHHLALAAKTVDSRRILHRSPPCGGSGPPKCSACTAVLRFPKNAISLAAEANGPRRCVPNDFGVDWIAIRLKYGALRVTHRGHGRVR